MSSTVKIRLLRDAVDTRLDTLSGVTIFANGKVDDPPKIQGDSTGAVAPYVVLWPSSGRTHNADAMCGPRTDLDWIIQLTCVAGYMTDCLALVDRVRDLLPGWAPAVANAHIGDLDELGDPGPIREDKGFTPYRYYLPLTYALIATT